MLIRCTREFRDLKADGRPLRAVGEVWEADASRLAELNGGRYGKLAEPAAPLADEPAEQEGPTEEPTAEPDDLSKMTKAQLLAEAEARGVDVERSYTKAMIIAALEE